MSDALETVSEMLEAMSDADTARRLRKQVQPLRGVRGVPLGEVARIAAAAFEELTPTVPRDAAALSTLFSTAFEDGLVAVGLLATCVPDAPADALEVGLSWVERVDDVLTADALGWLVLGPSTLLTGANPAQTLASVRSLSRGPGRRAAVAAGMAATPTPVEGPAAAPLRAKLGQARVQWVDAARSDAIGAIVDASHRDPDPAVRKAVRRLLRAWAGSDPAALLGWAEGVRGGLPSLYRSEVARARKTLKRAERQG